MAVGSIAPNFLRNQTLRIVLFGGKGGVGKTTCAVATSLYLARSNPEDSFLLVSTDPAHSVKDSLADSTLPPNLTVAELDAQGCLAKFKERHGDKLRKLALRGTFLDNDDINQFLSLSLPGLDELMALLEISDWVSEQRYRCVVVDSAPTGHTLRLLTLPDLLRRWVGALNSLVAKHRYLVKLYRGSHRRDEIDRFLDELESSVGNMEDLLKDSKRCCFVPVMLAEELVVSETEALVRKLEGLNIPIRAVVVNLLYPDNDCPACQGTRFRQERELRKLARLSSRYRLWGVPLYPEEVRGVETLDEFWNEVTPLRDAKVRKRMPGALVGNPQQRALEGKFLVGNPADLPASGSKLLLFAGKGGVGKTTLACATALRLSRDLDGREILLFSADPAHSLSACLDVQVGPDPVRIRPGLTAMEIDAEAEFETFRKQYAKMLEGFLESVLKGFDLDFDRKVLEKVIDLSPPGLDEVMALTRVVEFLAQGTYDIFILDMAPTGHLIRLLEMPHLVDQWLKCFFGLFLKYKRVLRLPEMSQRLIEISKNIKQLNALLGNASRAALYAVSIPTEMAFEETKDLTGACGRIGIHAPVLFLNLVTPTSDCPLCSALNKRESEVRHKFQETFSDKHQTLVFRQEEPRGLDRLEKLGEALYRPTGIMKDAGGVDGRAIARG